jgi:hypothetical protein
MFFYNISDLLNIMFYKLIKNYNFKKIADMYNLKIDNLSPIYSYECKMREYILKRCL